MNKDASLLQQTLDYAREELRKADRREADLAREVDRLRLTDAEREALEWGASFYSHHAATLRGLLERMK